MGAEHAESCIIAQSCIRQKTMHAIRFGVCRHFKSVRKLDVPDSGKFLESDKMMVKLKKEGKGYVQHKTAISDTDMANTVQSDAVDTSTPLGLQNKVFLDVMTYFGERGRENLHLMKVDDYMYVLHMDVATLSIVTHLKIKMGKRGRKVWWPHVQNTSIFEVLNSFNTELLKHLLNPGLNNCWQ